MQPEFTNYQSQVNSLFASYMMSMMTAMMNGLPMPPPPTTAAEPLTQNYQLQVAAENISLTDQLGGAMVAYVGTERATDTTRDLMIVAAINGDDQIAITDADLLEAAEIADIHAWMDNMVNDEAAFELADESHYVTMVDNIADDWKIFVQAEDADQEAFAVTESNDYLLYEQQMDGEVESFRNSEMGVRITMLDKEADDERDYEKSFALADQAWIDGEAAAQHIADDLASAAEMQRQDDEAGDYEQYVSDVAGDEATWVNTVTNGIATQFAAYYGNAADATAVANAWRNYDQSVAADWDNFAVGDAQDFQQYVQQEESALDLANQDIDTHNETREDNIATDMVNEVNAVAPAIDGFEQSVFGLMGSWMTTAAGAERTEGDQDAGSENGFELAVAPLLQSLGDTEASDTDNEIHTVEGDDSNEFTIVVGDEKNAALSEDAQLATELTTIRQKHTTRATDDLQSWDTKETTDLPAEDALMVAYATDLQAQGTLAAVNRFYGIAAQTLPSFDSQMNIQASLMPFAMPFAANDDTYIGWAGTIATVGPLTPPSLSLSQNIQEAVQPTQPLTSPQPAAPVAMDNSLEDTLLAFAPPGQVKDRQIIAGGVLQDARVVMAQHIRDQQRLDYYNSILHDVAQITAITAATGSLQQALSELDYPTTYALREGGHRRFPRNLNNLIEALQYTYAHTTTIGTDVVIGLLPATNPMSPLFTIYIPADRFQMSNTNLSTALGILVHETQHTRFGFFGTVNPGRGAGNHDGDGRFILKGGTTVEDGVDELLNLFDSIKGAGGGSLLDAVKERARRVSGFTP